MTSDPPTVFISYSHANETWKDRLVKQLRVLERGNVLRVWEDRQIPVGDDWQPAIGDAMERARVAVFLISADFLTSKFILEEEVPSILKRRESGLQVIPMIVDPCPWRRVSWLARIQAWPRDGKILALMTDAEAEVVLSNLVEEIADLLAGKEPEPQVPTGLRVSISRLPVTGEHFVGRDDELSRLDAAWAAPSTHVISVVAFGGVGKSALVNRWLDRLAADGWRGAERVLGWSFYSQGTDSTAASGDAFVDYALGWLGYEGGPIGAQEGVGGVRRPRSGPEPARYLSARRLRGRCPSTEWGTAARRGDQAGRSRATGDVQVRSVARTFGASSAPSGGTLRSSGGG